MEKKYLDDVVPPAQKRSIRDIPVPARKGRGQNPIHKSPNTKSVESNTRLESPKKNGGGNLSEEMVEVNEEILKKSGGGNSGNKIKKYLTWGGVIIVLIAIFLVLSSFDSAKVTIKPKQVETSVNKNMEIADLSGTDTSYDLGYRTIELAKEASTVVEADSEEFVQQKASGIITIYNNYSSEEQNLIRNTRFESPEGLIYRIQESVTVPGYTGSESNITPGSLDVEVVADEFGDEYNVDSATFTIPGFKGQEPYEFFSAETKTAISGGFDGVRKVVSESNIETASAELKESVNEMLVNELQNQITDEFIAVYNSGYFTYQNIEQSDDPNSEGVILKLKGELAAKVFNKIDLSNSVAVNTLNEYTLDQNVLIKDLDSGSLAITTDTVVNETEDEDGEIVETSENIENLNVSGSMNFVWQINEEEIKKGLMGVSENQLGDVMQNFVAVSGAESVIKPFWRSKFPTEIEKINIQIEN
jgi:hypothetical protein